MVVTDGLPGLHAQLRTRSGWADFALLPEGFDVPDEDGLIVLRARSRPARLGGAQLLWGDGEFIGVYERALVRVALRFAEANDVAVVLHWRDVPARATALAVAVAGWLRDTRAGTGQRRAVVTSAVRPRPEGGFVAFPHAVRLVGEPSANVWELRHGHAPDPDPDRGAPPRPSPAPATGPRPVHSADSARASAWLARSHPSPGTARVVRPGRPPR
ncbi:hypothetical protein I6A84_29520 [Frankia sp. CNm7]|uniref:Uncharacterized protein n=1 Tax=Frankia nepalensis TaxID=1836974 RepID=A0A937RG55_9ACTN|nr:hypothetical protein [Frankia nepalensis]MBL7502231.1 hypothetical protein [Frankia nepalensis]MBL7513037.1 hypothetical protein [Frankia nepalensis]MBL7522104.1 hypothetical protein [Frankia nepalensis]MBL7628264.1 hypothetical protein [Frankia nepalensis]